MVVSAKESTEVFELVGANLHGIPGCVVSMLKAFFCFPRVVGNVLCIRGRMNRLLWL